MSKSIISILVALLIGNLLAAQDNYHETTLIQLMQQKKAGAKGYIILDVRTPGEYMDTVTGGRHIGIGRIKDAVNISLQDLLNKPETIKKLDANKNDNIYVICSHSYRSRRISNLLLENGFTNVINVKGGMSEWYRNYDALQPYAASFYENNIPYHNIAPAQLFNLLKEKQQVLLIGFKNPPRFFFDSLVAPFYPVFPDIKNTIYYSPADSLAILERVKALNGGPVVFFSTIGGGASETANWLAQKGYGNVHHLIGNLTGFYEYLANFQPAVMNDYLSLKSKIRFYTPQNYCAKPPANVQWIDLRHDTSYNKVTKGTKLEYKTLKDAINFPFYRTADEFAQQFPDKSKMYMILPEQGYSGVALAEDLVKKGYNIGWIIGGLERWEWYSNNIDAFKCREMLVK